MDQKIKGQDEPSHIFSNSEKVGEWKTRPIALWGLIKSFIGQLKGGQDLTKISLPSELCHPYSMLELFCIRELSNFSVMFELNQLEDPVQRILCVVKHFLSMTRQEEFEKKPYNPVLGETHMGYLTNEEHGDTEFMTEQISHHPPISAYSVTNTKQQIRVNGDISFSVKFGGNSVSVNTVGKGYLYADKFDEVYTFSKVIPDMDVYRVVWGTKYIIWLGSITIRCEKTGYEANITFSEGYSRANLVKGNVCKIGTTKPILDIDGVCGGVTYTIVPETKQKTAIYNLAEQKLEHPHYLPRDKLEPYSSVLMWADVNQSIIDNKLEEADAAKNIVENRQRALRTERTNTGEEWAPKYFEQVDGKWQLKADMSIKNILSQTAEPLTNVDSTQTATAPTSEPAETPVPTGEAPNA